MRTMVLVLIRTAMRPDHDPAAYSEMEGRMSALVETMPGYLGSEGYGDEESSISIVKFASLEALKAWREHPEHVVAQRAGRERFYASYDVRVCVLDREAVFPSRA